MSDENRKSREQAALKYHARAPAGKIAVVPTKPCLTQRDLSLAYSPGVAVPCLAIKEDPSKAALYTARSNLVGVVTNGTAVLGLGDIGPLAGKPVMEGKGVLFKTFAGIDVFDIEVDAKDPEEFIRVVRALGPTFGGINLEDIKAPECFHIEQTLQAQMNIPVFHDDQHGTAIITVAALLNSLKITGKKKEDLKVVFSGAGAAATACGRFLVAFGIPAEHILFSDKDGVVYEGREGLDPELAKLARKTDARTLAEAIQGVDVFVGLSVGGVLTQEMVRSMAPNPVVFALANPYPEITYEDAKAARDDVIVATGRSDYPNQVNNVLGFPYIFRGALDSGATCISDEMKFAASRALAELAQEDVPDSVRSAYGGAPLRFGPEYLIPKPFDHRVLLWVAPAVAKAAAESGVATRPIEDLDAYRQSLASFLGRRRAVMSQVSSRARATPKRVVFPEGHKRRVLRACHELADAGVCEPVVIGNPDKVRALAKSIGLSLHGVEIIQPATSPLYSGYCDAYLALRQRRGVTHYTALSDMYDRVRFGMMMVREGDASGLVCGLSMHYPETIRPALQIVGLDSGVKRTAGMYVILKERRTLFFADTTVNIDPDAETLAEIALLTAREVRRFNIEPRVAMISFSNFGSSSHPYARKMREATRLVQQRAPDLVIEGEMQIDPAVDPKLAGNEFPFSTIQGDANVLIFPNLEAANVAYKLMMRLGEAEAVGPILLGMNRPVNVLPRGATSENVYNIASYTVLQAQYLDGDLSLSSEGD